MNALDELVCETETTEHVRQRYREAVAAIAHGHTHDAEQMQHDMADLGIADIEHREHRASSATLAPVVNTLNAAKAAKLELPAMVAELKAMVDRNDEVPPRT